MKEKYKRQLLIAIIALLVGGLSVACSKSTSLQSDSNNVSSSIAQESPDTIYNINYILDGGTNSANNLEQGYHTKPIHLFPAEKYGYTFMGWYYNGEIIEDLHIDNEVTSVELTAKWKIDAIYELGNGCFEVKGSNIEEPKKMEILSEYDGAPVKIIQSNAFEKILTLEQIVLPDSVKYINDYAFYGCQNLKEIDIGNGLYAIKNSAFGNCSNLENITFSESLTTIGDNAFEECEALSYVQMFDFITEIGDCAFQSCTSLTEIVLSKALQTIGNNAFNGCASLINVTLPESVKHLGDAVFANCTEMQTINLPDDISMINTQAFLNCTNLRNIVLPKSCREIQEKAFSGCSAIKTITIYDKLTKTFYAAFENCNSLEKVDYYGDIATWTSITFGNSSYSYSFDTATPPNFTCNPASLSGCLYIKGEKIVDLDLSTCSNLSAMSFAYCSSIKSVNLGNSIASIGSFAFLECSGIESITIPNSVTTIGIGAFHNCVALKNLDIDFLVNSTERNLLYNAFYGCTGLEKVNYDNGRATHWCTINFANLQANPLYYAKHLYHCGEEIVTGTISSTINDYAFVNCEGFTQIKLLSNVGKYAFYGCKNLTDLYIAASSVKSLSEGCFMNCSALSTIQYTDTRSRWRGLIQYVTDWNRNTGNYIVVCTDVTINKQNTIV